MLAINRVRRMIQDQGYDQLAYEWGQQNKYDLRKEVREQGLLEKVWIVGLIFITLPLFSLWDIVINKLHVTWPLWFTVIMSLVLGLFVFVSCTWELLKMNRMCKEFYRWNKKREAR